METQRKMETVEQLKESMTQEEVEEIAGEITGEISHALSLGHELICELMEAAQEALERLHELADEPDPSVGQVAALEAVIALALESWPHLVGISDRIMAHRGDLLAMRSA